MFTSRISFQISVFYINTFYIREDNLAWYILIYKRVDKPTESQVNAQIINSTPTADFC